MKPYLQKLFLILVLYFLSFTLFAESLRNQSGKLTINQMSRYSQVELKASRYRFQAGEKINIRFRIKNTGYQIIRFYPKLTHPNSFKFLVVDTHGREIHPRLNTHDFTQVKPVVNLHGDRVKEIMLHPNETFEKNIALNQLYDLQAGKQYRISGYFWPSAKNRGYFIRSKNTIKIIIDKKTSHSKIYNFNTDINANVPLVTPEETIFLFLAAEMRQNWNNHLKFIDLKRYITSYDRYASAYVKASPTKKSKIIRKFKTYLKSNPADKLQKFKIVRSEPERDSNSQERENGRYFVFVSALRSDRGYSVRYEYKYTLEQILDHEMRSWKIINVEATLKNTGSNDD